MSRLLCTIFLISGASALMFETLWFRQAGLAFGNSIWASALVLSGFMAGLALGNGLAVLERGRTQNPVRAYAVLELLIGISGILLVYVLPAFGRIFAPWFRPILDEPWLLNPLRLLLAFLLLLVPSTAMGLTLPLLTKALSAGDPVFGRVLGRLYGWNTLGALIGVLLTEFILVGIVGIRATAWFAGFLNLAVAAIAWRIGGRLAEEAKPQKEKVTQEIFAQVEKRPFPLQFLLAAFLSGFALLALEIIWFRFLMLFVSGLSESFSLMLAIILAGIAFGGFSASRILKRRPAFAQQGATLAFMLGISCIMSYAFFPAVIRPYLQTVISNPGGILAVGIPLMFPVSFFSGLFFTVIGTALRAHLQSETATTGSLTLANTTGAALGAFAAGFFLLPTIGMEKSLFLIAVVYGVIALLLMMSQKQGFRTAYVGAALFATCILLFPQGTMESDFLTAPIRRLIPADGEGKITEIREGQIETVSYLEQQWQGKPLFHRLITNSYSMSSSDFRSRRYMKLFVYWPLALHPEPKDALLISYGVGSTAKALKDSRILKRIDVVDISRDILEMNDNIFKDPAEHPLNDPRVHVHIEDGRYFLQTTDRHFDLITGEPPPPEIAGVVNLYTREYFELLYERLNEGGMVTYWLPLHAMSADSIKGILRAFCDVFKDCSLWQGQWLDMMMVGTRNAGDANGPVSEAQFKRQWQDPHVSAEMKRLGFELPEQLGPLFIGDADYLNKLTENSLPLIDDFPKRAYRAFGMRIDLVRMIDQWNNAAAAQARFIKSPLISKLWPEKIRRDSFAYFGFQNILNRHWSGMRKQDEPVIADLHEVLSKSNLTTLPLWLMGSDADHQGILDELEKKSEISDDPMMQVHLSMKQMAERDYEAAAHSLTKAEVDPKLAGDAFSYRVYALSMAGRNKDAQTLAAEKMTKFLKEDPQRALTRPQLSPFWMWMKDNLDIDPFAKGE